MYNIFISHSWAYSDAYDFVVDSLDTYLGSNQWRDYSVPMNDPIHSKSDKELREAIDNKIRYSSGVIILAGVYASYSRWINIEIDIAKKYNKPILAVKHWGAQRVSTVVSEAAHKIVGWYGPSIANAVKDLF